MALFAFKTTNNYGSVPNENRQTLLFANQGIQAIFGTQNEGELLTILEDNSILAIIKKSLEESESLFV